MTLTCIGRAAPDFVLSCVSALQPVPRTMRLCDYAGHSLILIFYPRDFSLVCPTELTAFSARLPDFHQRNCDLLGVSADSVQLHQEWLATPVAEGGIGPLRFPLASDVHGITARAYGVWVEENQQPTRGLFLRVLDEESSLACILRLRTDDIGAGLAAKIDSRFRAMITAMLAREPGCRPAMYEVAGQLTALCGPSV